MTDRPIQSLNDEELERRKRRRRYARASLAISGSHLTPEQEALFDMFERERLSDADCTKILIERAKAAAANEQLLRGKPEAP